ncbi:MAG: LCP family protein [Bacillaceae bacterium]|nr:LCP family protein [Bacillaceae bacterium]
MSKKKKKKDRLYKGILIVITMLVVMVFGIVGYGAYQYQDMVDRWHKPWEDSPADQKQDGKDAERDQERDMMDPFTILLLGVDSRGAEHSRSDTMMLAAVNPREEKVLLISIPRDTYVKIPGYGYDKFNHSMFYGGPPLVRKTIENFLGVDVDHYVSVDFEGFRRVVDELGGIEIDVKKRMVYYDPSDGTSIDLYPGLQTLDGENALDYARYRMSSIGPPDSDFDRIERQHEVIRALIEKGKQFGSVLKVFSLMDILGDHVQTNLTSEEIRELFLTFHDFSSERLVTEDVYGTNQRIESHNLKLWFYVVDENERERLRALIESYLEVNNTVEQGQ